MTKYINREISWLKFNERVLQEAEDKSVPLIERMHFLGIYSNNLDEFYSVRYSALLRSIQLKDVGPSYKNIIEQQSNKDLIGEINSMVVEQRLKYDLVYDSLLKKLEVENIYFVDDVSIPEEHKHFMKHFFENKIYPTISIYILEENHPTPPLRDGAFYLAVKMKKADKNQYALVSVPTDLFGRFILLPSIEERKYVIYLEDIIRYHLEKIFRIFYFDAVEAHSIKITRDSELDMDNDLQRSFLEKISLSLEARKKGEPVRMVYDKEIAADTLSFLFNKLQLDEYDSINPGGKYHNRRDLMKFPTMGREDLVYPEITPLKPKSLQKFGNFFEAFTAQDHMIYVPYHDYAVFVRFLREAAIDPKVKKIKITIYRVAQDSQIMHALVNAALNGKEVTAVLELRARFDEENNIKWSKRLQKAGVNVIFGIPGLKVHSKVGLIERLPEEGYAEKYAFVSTGNFHAGNAKVYTDFTLFTTKECITKEIEQLFKFFSANYLIQSYKHLIIFPIQGRKKIVKLIKKEIKNKRKGLIAQINLKLNSLSDKEIINLLYKASQAGVEVRLVIRGIHCLIPKAEGLSENIESVSVVDKFLEHPRVYWFKNAGEDKVFISSSDFMERNIDYRVEVACPVYAEDLKKIIMDTFEFSFYDNVKGRLHDAENTNTYRRNDLTANRSQLSTYQYLKNIDEN